MSLEIREVKTSKDLKCFVALPFELYKGNPYWVPPLTFDEINTLSPDKNPAFAYCDLKCWLAFKDGKPVGRIAGIINRQYVEKWGRKHARFGWLDFIDSQEVCGALLSTVEQWAKAQGMTGVHGPLGFCDLDKEGMLVEGFFEKSMFITLYNHPYYPQHMEHHGYGKDVDWVEYEIMLPQHIPERVDKIARVVEARHQVQIIRPKRSKDILPYARGIFALLNEAYRELYGVVPLTEAQVEVYVKQYFAFINPDYVRVVLNADGDIIAFGIALPSLTEAAQRAKGRLLPWGFWHFWRALKKNDRLDLYLIAVRPDYQMKGINALLMTEIQKSCLKNGIKFAETGPELEENVKVQALWKHFDVRQHKRRRCYHKKLADG